MSSRRQTSFIVAGSVAAILVSYALFVPWEMHGVYERRPLFLPAPDGYDLAVPQMLWEVGVITIVSAAFLYVLVRDR